MDIKYDYSKLRGLIREHFESLENFSSAIPMGRTTLNNKLQCKNYFTQIEIERICSLLKIQPNERQEVFFKTK